MGSPGYGAGWIAEVVASLKGKREGLAGASCLNIARGRRCLPVSASGGCRSLTNCKFAKAHGVLHHIPWGTREALLARKAEVRERTRRAWAAAGRSRSVAPPRLRNHRSRPG